MRLYLTPADFADTALGGYWSAQGPSADQIGRALARGSRQADAVARRRFGAPGSTTLTSPVSVGATSIALADVSNIDGGDILDLAGGSERILVQGVRVTAWSGPPYPGVATLATPTVNPYSSGTPALGLIYERKNVRGRSTNAIDLGGPVTQESQTAMAHAPHDLASDLVRTVFLGATPVGTLAAVNIVLRWGGTPYPITLANIALNSPQGWYRLPIGTFVPPGSDVETLYVGGYTTVPEDVSEAVGLLAADDLLHVRSVYAQAFIDAKSATQAVSTAIRGDVPGKTQLRSRAEYLLSSWVRLV